jgi:NAD(P)-dependent dehydrogenase (short-subunit alcohol dehydrogenase family)
LPANKVALVTGASRGIGAQVAIDLAKNGFYVVVNYLSDKFSADKVVEEIQSSGGVCIAIKADIKRENDVIALVEEVNDKFGSCDIVVHGATPSIYSKYVNEITYDDVDRYLQVYLGGSINLVKHISPRMKEKNFGRFIFLGTSYLFETPPDGYSSYIIAKEALWGYVRTLSASLGKYGITTNMVSPSLTITDLTRDVPVRVKEIEAIKSPIRRLITTKDIAHRITSLCSKESGYENGKNIPITGGMV